MFKDLLYDWFNIKRSNKKFNLLILGAQKCGTTSLHETLNQHPQIFMTNPIKEPGFFLPFEVMQNYYAARGLNLKSKAQYLNNFLLKGYQSEKYFGESSTFYSTFEWSTADLANKIYNYNSNCKLIYVYRNRTDRIISHFFHEKAKNNDLTLRTFLNTTEALEIGNYYNRIKPYLDVFPRKNIMFICFEELIENHNKVLKQIFNFLQIDIGVEIENFPKKNSKSIVTNKEKEHYKKIIEGQLKFIAQTENDKLFMHIAKTKF